MLYDYAISTKEAQTFAIRFTVHHKPPSNMGSLRPFWGSPNFEGLLVAFAVVIVKLLSNMSLRSFRIAGAKVVKKIENATRFVQKILKW